MTRFFSIFAAAAVLAGLTGGFALAERSQQGNLIASLQGKVSPLKLPRHHPAPVSVELSGSLRTVDGSTLPRVIAMQFDLAGQGGLVTRGLPVCREVRLRDTRDPEALAACRSSLVGRGKVDAELLVPGQAPLSIHTRLLVFYGTAQGGHAALLLHAYANNPPLTVVIPFRVSHPRGRFGTQLTATLPKNLPWPRAASFEMTLSRRWSSGGHRHSFLVASCPLPPRFTAGFLAFARLGFSLAEGQHIATETVRSCRAR